MYFDADLSQAWSCTVWLRWFLWGNDGSDRISFDTLCIGRTWAKDINRLYKAHPYDRILQVSVKFDQSSVRASNKKNFHKIWLQLGRSYETTERVLFLLPLYDLSNAILLFYLAIHFYLSFFLVNQAIISLRWKQYLFSSFT